MATFAGNRPVGWTKGASNKGLQLDASAAQPDGPASLRSPGPAIRKVVRLVFHPRDGNTSGVQKVLISG